MPGGQAVPVAPCGRRRALAQRLAHRRPVRATRPGWDLWRDGVVPGDADHPGERLQQVAARTDAMLDRIRPLLSEGDVAVVAHGHLARVLTVRRLGLDASASRLLGHPHPGTLGLLAIEDGQPCISTWNVP
ncbi:histidine phosphatase family protein [Streptomyces sp. NPDC052051]|uniref:histidine phosphatase family protein n=1 Tax=Streptomyces sp. NPDC052051 TaxID=3154649 RepID=UPI00342CACD2